jgi:hypothetical protein
MTVDGKPLAQTLLVLSRNMPEAGVQTVTDGTSSSRSTGPLAHHERVGARNRRSTVLHVMGSDYTTRAVAD